MSNDNYIDVDYIDVEKEIFLTAPDVAREIPADEKRVRYWGDVFGDIKECGVYKIDGRKKYTKHTIRAFKIIQKLIDDKQFSHVQVRDYISKNGFEYISGNKNDLSKDLIGYNGLSSELSVELEQKLKAFQESIKNMMLDHSEYLKEQVALTVDEVVSDALEPLKKDLKQELKSELKEYNSENVKLSEDLKEKIDNGFKDLDKKSEERDLKLVEKLRDDTKDAKIKALEKEVAELKSNNQGFFSKIFGKKN